MDNFRPNTQGLKVLTINGYQKFDGVAYMGYTAMFRLNLEGGLFIECTADHKIFTTEAAKAEVQHLMPGDTVCSLSGPVKVLEAYYTGEKKKVYDLIGVENGNRFYANNLLVSNCEFISIDETLISSLKLAAMFGIMPFRKTGQIRWYEPLENGRTYLVGLDPALGTGGDYGAIQIFSVPELTQVGEFQSNIDTIQEQMITLREILTEIEEACPESDIYYTIENNGVGQAAIMVLTEMTRDVELPGILMNEPKKSRKGKYNRLGYTTTFSSKTTACVKLKRWIQEDMMKISSKNLVRELKGYIAKGTSAGRTTFEAKEGETDDLVDAALLVVRMVTEISKYDDGIFDDLKDNFNEEEYREPMPIGILI